MTTITSYTTLITAVTEYLARDQDATLVARIPTFIQLAEAKFNRELTCRLMETRSTTSADTSDDEPEFITLPSDFQAIRRVRLSGVSGKPVLDFMSQVQLDEYRASIGNVSRQPLFYTVIGTEIELVPTPDADYTIEMVYRIVIPPLISNSTNWLLTLAPDLYLYGALLESSPYIKEDSRIQTWGLGFTTALDGLNRVQGSLNNPGPMAVRVSGRTP